MDNQSLFGTTRALRWISLSFTRMLMRPQEGNEVVLIMGLCIKAVGSMPLGAYLRTALLMLMNKWHLRGVHQLTSAQRRVRVLQLWAVLVTYLIATAGNVIYFTVKVGASWDPYVAVWLADTLAGILAQVVAVLLLNIRPQRIANLTSKPHGRKLVSLAKVISAIWLAYSWALLLLPRTLVVSALSTFNTSFTIIVLSFGSLQTPATANTSLLGRWLHAILHILFLWDLLITFNACPHCVISSLLLLAALLVRNLQIPAAVAQVVLSSWRLCGLRAAHHDYYQQPSQNLVPSIKVFYTLTLCQGAFYIMACVLGVFSYFPRRSLIRRSGLTGHWGSKAVQLYYRRVYTTRMETGVLAAGSKMTLDTFAMESMSSSSREVLLAGVRVLDSLLDESSSDSKEGLVPRVASSGKALSTLISMLGPCGADVEDASIRLFAAKVTAKIAGHLRISEVPAGMVKSVSSLLHAKTNLSLTAAGTSWHTDGHSTEGKDGGRSWVCQCWHRVKDEWSVPEEPPLTQQDSLPVLGMVILERLAAHDPDNCVEIVQVTNLISKIIGLITYTTDNDNEVICSSLHLVRRIARTGGKIGAAVRQKLWESPLLLDNLAGILEDSRSSSFEVRTPTMDIIAKLALDEDARQEIGSTQVIIGKLIHAFLGRDEPNDQSLRMAAGEALANLTMESTANCSAILEEPGYELVKDLKDMLFEDEYRIYTYVTSSVLQNLCAYSRDKLMSHPGASEHLRSALPAAMENIVPAEGKQLETLIGLASQICTIPGCFFFELESQTHVAGVVKKLVSTLNSNRKPSPEYPRMRRVTVELVISLATSYPGYRTMLREEGVMEALSKAARTPSKVEKYRVFSGDEGVVVEHGVPLCDLVERAKELIGSAIPAPSAQPDDHA